MRGVPAPNRIIQAADGPSLLLETSPSILPMIATLVSPKATSPSTRLFLSGLSALAFARAFQKISLRGPLLFLQGYEGAVPEDEEAQEEYRRGNRVKIHPKTSDKPLFS